MTLNSQHERDQRSGELANAVVQRVSGREGSETKTKGSLGRSDDNVHLALAVFGISQTNDFVPVNLETRQLRHIAILLT